MTDAMLWLEVMPLVCLTSGFGAAWLVALLRTTSWVMRRAVQGQKPWSCDVCMSFWTAALYQSGSHVFVVADGVPIPVVLASFIPAVCATAGVAYAITALLSMRPPEDDPPF